MSYWDGISTRRKLLTIAIFTFYGFSSSIIFFGFAALKPLLVQEQVYRYLCEDDESSIPNHIDSVETVKFVQPCVEQSLRLDLIFAVAAFAPASCLPVGVFMDYVGSRTAYMTGTLVMVLGCVAFAFANDKTFDVFVPAYLCIAVAGQTVSMSTLHLANVIPSKAGLIMSILNTSFDAAAFVFFIFQFIYTLADGAISVRMLFLCFSVVPLSAMVCAFLLMPPKQDHSKGISRAESMDIKDPSKRLHFVSLRKQVTSIELILFCLAMCAYTLRINFYIGTVDSQLLQFTTFDTAEKMTAVFAVILAVAGLFTVVPVGWMLDHQKLSTTHFVLWASFALFGVSSLIPVVELQYVSFVLLSALRPLYYSAASDFIARWFGLINFGKLWGITMCISSVFGLLQYPLNYLSMETLGGSFMWVNIGQATLCGLAIVFPLYAWWVERHTSAYAVISTSDGLHYPNANLDLDDDIDFDNLEL